MRKIQWRTAIVTLAVGMGVAGSYHLGSVRADGAPTTTPLYYSGYATDGATPIDGMRDVRIELWRDATSTDTAMRACETVANGTSFVDGHFRVALDAACVDATRAEPELFVELLIGGTRIGERAAIGAVPYSLESDHAVRASAAVPGSALALATLPAGSVVAFDLPACPAGWSAFTAADGRAIIGASASFPRGTPVGNRNITLTAAQLPPHTHSNASGNLSSGGSLPTISTNAPSVTFGWETGPGPGTSAPIDILGPSLPLLYCRKM